jgi:hypothetical protein
MSNTLIDLEGLKAFYIQVQEDLKLYAKYEDYATSSGSFIAPTIAGGTSNVIITNNDPRNATAYCCSNTSFESGNIVGYSPIANNETITIPTPSAGNYYVKLIADDGTESDIYSVYVLAGGGYD